MDFRVKLSLLNVGSWSIFFIVFCIAFFSSTQPEVLPLSNYRTTTAIIFAIANIVNLIILYVMKKSERTDERNLKIEAISAVITMVIMMILFFLASMILYIINVDSGTAPVSWFWFLAYGSIFSVFILFNLSYVIISYKGFKYES